MKNFYKKFQIVSHLPGWRVYLREVYKRTNDDAKRLNRPILEERESPTCLLCGASGEITADEFIKFALANNPNSKIIIIDIGDEQIQSVTSLVKSQYSSRNIVVQQANALNLSFIADKSVDWIDTDGFFSFFNEENLRNLFEEWKRIIKSDGYITFRELVTSDLISLIANKLRALLARLYMDTSLHLHSLNELQADFKDLDLEFLIGHSPIPLLNRYCLANSE